MGFIIKADIEVSRLRVHGLSIDVAALKLMCVRGAPTDIGRLHVLHHLVMRWFMRKGVIAIPMCFNPPVFGVSERVDVGELEAKLRKLFGSDIKIVFDDGRKLGAAWGRLFADYGACC